MIDRELRFDADVDLVLPDLSGTRGVSRVTEPVDRTLEATYFDTPDHRLGAVGVRLRRRTGGDDDGWHLELPSAAEPDTRHELRIGPGRAVRTVPKRFRDTLAGLVGNQTAGPIATVTTRRTTRQLLDERGRVLAEVADDRVEAIATSNGTRRSDWNSEILMWRELDVELVEGSHKVLSRVGKRLVDAGAEQTARPSQLAGVLGEYERGAEQPTSPKDSVRQLMHHRLGVLVAELQVREPLVREGLPEGVHTMRVAIRRLRSLLATGRPFLVRSVTDPLRDELTWLADALGEVRDAEVRRERLDASVDELVEERFEVDWEPGRVRSLLWSALVEDHDRAQAALDEMMATTRYHALLDQLRGLVADPPWTAQASKRVRGAYLRRTRRELNRLDERMQGALDPANTPEERGHLLHEARKATKRARYALEPLRPIYGDAATSLVERLERLQSALGQHQDTVVTREYLLGLSHQTRPTLDPAAALVAGALIERESREAEAYDAHAARAWSDVVRSSFVD